MVPDGEQQGGFHTKALNDLRQTRKTLTLQNWGSKTVCPRQALLLASLFVTKIADGRRATYLLGLKSLDLRSDWRYDSRKRNEHITRGEHGARAFPRPFKTTKKSQTCNEKVKQTEKHGDGKHDSGVQIDSAWGQNLHARVIPRDTKRHTSHTKHLASTPTAFDRSRGGVR